MKWSRKQVLYINLNIVTRFNNVHGFRIYFHTPHCLHCEGRGWYKKITLSYIWIHETQYFAHSIPCRASNTYKRSMFKLLQLVCLWLSKSLWSENRLFPIKSFSSFFPQISIFGIVLNIKFPWKFYTLYVSTHSIHLKPS